MRASATKLPWPSWRAPIVGINPIEVDIIPSIPLAPLFAKIFIFEALLNVNLSRSLIDINTFYRRFLSYLLDLNIPDEYSLQAVPYKPSKGGSKKANRITADNMRRAIKKGELKINISDDDYQKILNNAFAACALMKDNFQGMRNHMNFVGAYIMHQQGKPFFQRLVKNPGNKNILGRNQRGNKLYDSFTRKC